MIREGLCFINRNENIWEYIEKNEGLCIVISTVLWGEILVAEGRIGVDYFFVISKEKIDKIFDVPVINDRQLQELIWKSGKRATIVMCLGMDKGLVTAFYSVLTRLEIQADVFDYFENSCIFSDKYFDFKGKTYPLYEHSFNCGYSDTRMTERSVEIALGIDFIKSCNSEIIEVGAVTPYYFRNNKIKEVVDPTDLHNRVTIRKSLFECDLRGKNVLSISTVEHIGTQDYGMTEKRNVIDAIEKITSEAATCLITAPLGYNKLLDDWVRNNKNNPLLRVMMRCINNHWIEIDLHDYIQIVYTPLWACGLLVIEMGGGNQETSTI